MRKSIPNELLRGILPSRRRSYRGPCGSMLTGHVGAQDVASIGTVRCCERGVHQRRPVDLAAIAAKLEHPGRSRRRRIDAAAAKGKLVKENFV